MSTVLATSALLLVVTTIPAAACTVESGWASHYGDGDGFAWRRTASGERFNPHAMTAAHKTLPFETMAHVTRAGTNRTVVVRITDRGPFVPGRIIDLSLAAAEGLGMRREGVVRVMVVVCR